MIYPNSLVKCIFFSLILSFSSITGLLSQEKNIDSLKQELGKTDSVIEKLNLFISLTGEYSRLNNDSAFLYSDSCIKISQKLQDNQKIAECWLANAILNMKHNLINQSISSFIKSLNYFEISGDSTHIQMIYVELCQLYLAQNNLEKTIYYALRAFNS